MKLPNLTLSSHAIQILGHTAYQPADAVYPVVTGILPMGIIFENNLYGNQVQERQNIIQILRRMGGPIGNIARSQNQSVTVTTGWHTSPADQEEHLTVNVNGTDCHVYRTSLLVTVNGNGQRTVEEYNPYSCI